MGQRMSRSAAIAIVLAASAILGMGEYALAQSGDYTSASNGGIRSPLPTGANPTPYYAAGGIFRSQLFVPVALIGWEELYGGCPDGDTGQWIIDQQPSYGNLSTSLVTADMTPGCNTPNTYNTLSYTLTQPIPVGLSDPFSAHWQSGHVGPQNGSWQAAYLPVTQTHNYFGLPCGGCLPFGGTGFPPSDWMMSGKYIRVNPNVPASTTTENAFYLWEMANNKILAKKRIGFRSADWSMLGQRDFNGDGKTDILWGHTNRALEIWLMDGFQVTSKTKIGKAPADSTLVGTGALISDVNGAIVGSLLWHNNVTGRLFAWFTNGTQITGKAHYGGMSTNWTVLGNDNKGDIFWRNKINGQVKLWRVSGDTGPNSKVVAQFTLGTIASNWQFVGLGDFDGDGYIDILWRDAITGAPMIWFTGNDKLLSKATLAARSSDWTIGQTGDYDGDGKTDIAWVNSLGHAEIWFMDGGTVARSVRVGTIANGLSFESRNSE